MPRLKACKGAAVYETRRARKNFRARRNFFYSAALYLVITIPIIVIISIFKITYICLGVAHVNILGICHIIIFFRHFPARLIFKSYAFKASATRERPLTDKSYAIRNCYALKPCTTFEHIPSDTSYTIRYNYACKFCTIIERTIADISYAVGYGYRRFCTRTLNKFCFIFIIQNAVLTCKIIVIRTDRNIFKACTTSKYIT